MASIRPFWRHVTSKSSIFALIFILLSPALVVGQCVFSLFPQDVTSIFSDLSIPRTLVISESVSYTICTQTVTQLVTLYIDGTAHFAPPVIYTFYTPSIPLTVTYNFPDVTMTSLSALQTVLYQYTITAAADPLLTGRGFYQIIVPPQTNSPTRVTSTSTSGTPTSTSTSYTSQTLSTTSSSSTTTSSSTPIQPGGNSQPQNDNQGTSSGLSGGAIGGIAGGVIGGLLVLGIIGFLLYKRKSTTPYRAEPTVYPDGYNTRPEPKPEEPTQPAIRYPDPDAVPVGEDTGPVGGRLRYPD